MLFPSDDPFAHSCQSNVLNCCTIHIFCALHIVLLAIQTTRRMYLSLGWLLFQWKIMLMFLFKSSVYSPSGISLLKALFIILLKGVNFLRRFILRVIYSAGTNFCGSRSIRKIRTNKNPQNFHATWYVGLRSRGQHVPHYLVMYPLTMLLFLLFCSLGRLVGHRSHLFQWACVRSSCQKIWLPRHYPTRGILMRIKPRPLLPGEKHSHIVSDL